jgi:membrane protein required for colicin V production
VSNLMAIDFIALSFFVISFIFGLMRGVIKEVLSLLKWIASGLAAMNVLQAMAYFGIDYVPDNNLMLLILKVSIFLIVLFLFSLVINLIKNLIKNLGLGWFDRFLGGVFGIIRGIVIVGVLYYFSSQLPFDSSDWWSDSRMVNFYENFEILKEPDELIDSGVDITDRVINSGTL